jgi:hypothetical protein
MTNALLKMGFPPDQLDIISEYGAQLSRAGYNAEQIQGIFAAGIKSKSWNIDNLMDGLKEGRIRLAEFGQGVDKTTAGLIKGTAITTQQLQGWGQAIAAGGEPGRKAILDVAQSLSKITNESQRNAIGVQLFGTMWEDQGKKITETLINADANIGNTAANQQHLNDTVAAMDESPQVRFNKALTDMQTALIPLLVPIAQFIAQIADWMSKNPVLAATIAAVVVALGILVGIIMGLVPFVLGLITAWEILAVVFGAITGPIWIVIGVIVALIAIGVALYRNWDTVRAKASELVANIRVQFEAFKAAAETKMNAAKAAITNAWNSVMSFFRGIDLGSIGRNMMNGLSGATGALKRKAQEIANGLPKWMKDVLHISSPSKIMMEIGMNTGLGLAQGMNNSLSRINSASDKMAAATMPNMSNNVSHETIVQGNSGSTLTVNLNSPKALDVREANREFNRTLNRMAMNW